MQRSLTASIVNHTKDDNDTTISPVLCHPHLDNLLNLGNQELVGTVPEEIAGMVENLVSREQVDVGVKEVSTTTSVSGKRERSPSREMGLVWSSDKGDDPAQKRCKKAINTVAGEELVCSPVGLGQSSIAARNAWKSAEARTFIINARKLENWKNKILILDHYAEFYPQDVCHVRHAKCGTVIKVKEPYDTTQFA